MNDHTRKTLIHMTNDFYSQVASEFDLTRQKPWHGWEEVWKHIPNTPDTKVLDLGCGNGRLAKFINKQGFQGTYLGIDVNQALLNSTPDLDPARYGFKAFDFLSEPLYNEITNQTFDVITLFGVTHHLPGKDFRSHFFSQLNHLLKVEGLLAFSVWNFLNKPTIKAKLIDWRAVTAAGYEIDIKEIEDGDYALGWAETNQTYRYCHAYTSEEIDQLLHRNHFKIISEFEGPGPGDLLNQYYLARVERD